MPKILVVEDEPEILVTVEQWLRSDNHIVDTASSGTEAIELLTLMQYDIVVLDWGLPGMSGIEVLKRFRAGGGTTPVIMLTGKQTLEEKETGLDSGCDDYLTKPFQLRELSARIRSVLRRSTGSGGASNLLSAGDLVMDTAAHQTTKNGQPIKLMPKEYALLEFLLRHPNTVFTAEALIARVWPTDSETSSEMIRNYISRIREKIDSKGQSSIISTVHGIGYRLDAVRS